MMRLVDLEPEFIHSFREEGRHGHTLVDTLAEANGVMFLCPVCFAKNNGPIGTHMIICWGPSVPQDIRPGPGRWEMHGTGLEDLTLVAGSSSVQLMGGCNAHFYIKNGDIIPC